MDIAKECVTCLRGLLRLGGKLRAQDLASEPLVDVTSYAPSHET